MHQQIHQPLSSIAILVNPLAGKGVSLKFDAWLEIELKKRNIQFQVFKNDWPESFDNFSDIWIMGGDGSINYFINRFPNCKTPLALFKTGTGNDFSWKLYGELTNEEIFEKVLISEPKPVDVGRCNHTLFINSFGIGFDGEILKSMNAIRFLGGHLGYMVAVVLKILSFREHRFQVNTEEESWNEQFLLLIINNSSRAGGGFKITPDANINDGLLDLCLCNKLTVFQRLRYLPVLKSGKHTHLPFVTLRKGKSFRISAEKEIAIQVDGELISAKNVKVDVLPKQFNFRY
ncbi:MAG: YegS/Rv2252/BmrU family lipid kinase [Bacteroidetes bacterium]|nr:YegS/Rv2252/BmrU family lipid kinase [Bacteroidota bacterium]